MPEQKYRERRASVCACLRNSIVCLETLTFLTTIALQRHIMLPETGLCRLAKREHYTKNSREWTRCLWPSLCISAPHHLLRQSRRGNLTGELRNARDDSLDGERDVQVMKSRIGGDHDMRGNVRHDVTAGFAGLPLVIGVKLSDPVRRKRI